LREREKDYKMQIDMLETTQEELAKKNHSNLKVLRFAFYSMRRSGVC